MPWVARLRVWMPPVADQAGRWTGLVRRVRRQRWIENYWPFLLFVILPTLVASVYYFAVAADQYLSEARFIVRGETPPIQSLLGQALNVGGLHPAEQEMLSVEDYLESHDAVHALEQKLDLVTIYRRPEADFFARAPLHPSAEALLKYYRGMVTAEVDSKTGGTILRVRAFRPDDAQAIARDLLGLSEALVNGFSVRAQEDTLRVAREEVTRAEERVAAVREKLTQFRDQQQAIDPGKSTAMILEVLGKLEGDLAKARTEQTEARSYLQPDNPRFLEINNRIKALEQQILAQESRLTGKDGALAPVLGAYERLMLEREFADKDYASALASLETARINAEKQHLWLVQVVEPNLAEEALYPRRLLIVASLFVGLLVSYGIGWLIVAGVREHVA